MNWVAKHKLYTQWTSEKKWTQTWNLITNANRIVYNRRKHECAHTRTNERTIARTHARWQVLKSRDSIFFSTNFYRTTIASPCTAIGHKTIANSSRIFSKLFFFLWPQFRRQFSFLHLFFALIWLIVSGLFLSHSACSFSLYLIFNPYTAFCHFACENVL